MEHSMNAPVFTSGTMVLMTRWDRELAAKLVERHRITHWTNISTMVVDLLSNPEMGEHDLSFIDELPKSGSGKILWRELQERAGELREGAADLGKHERSALTPCSAGKVRDDTDSVPKGADGGLPGAPEGRDSPRAMRVSETIQVREDERFDAEVQECPPPPVVTPKLPKHPQLFVHKEDSSEGFLRLL
jgi:hypothetical protein